MPTPDMVNSWAVDHSMGPHMQLTQSLVVVLSMTNVGLNPYKSCVLLMGKALIRLIEVVDTVRWRHYYEHTLLV